MTLREPSSQTPAAYEKLTYQGRREFRRQRWVSLPTYKFRNRNFSEEGRIS
jgi:hypothetical protein